MSDKYDGPAHYSVTGQANCGRPAPKRAQSVWFQRTRTGGPTIYLFPDRVPLLRSGYSNRAFGWISEGLCEKLWLDEEYGWCEFIPRTSAEAERLNAHHNYTSRDRVKFDRVVNQHWKTPSEGAVPQQLNKEESMSNFDPNAALAAQQERLYGAKQGRTVSLKDKCGSAVDTIVTNNKTAAKQAAFNEVGRIANNVAAKTLAKHLPAMARGYADTPIGKLLIANLAITAQQHFKPGDPTLSKVTSAMGVAAYGEVFKAIDVEGFINSILADKALQNALTAAGDD